MSKMSAVYCVFTVASIIVTSLVCSHPVQIQGNIAINLWRVSDPPQTTTTTSTPSIDSSEVAKSVSSSDAIVKRADAPMAIEHERPMDTEMEATNDIPQRMERTSDSIVHHEVQQQENNHHKDMESKVSGDHILAMHSEAVMHHQTNIDNQEIPVQPHDQSDAELAVETMKNGEELRSGKIMKMDSAEAQAERQPFNNNIDTEHSEKLISDQRDNFTMEANEKHREESEKSEADGLTVEVKETPKTEETMLHHNNSETSLLSESAVITVAQISAEPQTQAEIIVSAAIITSTDVLPNVETFSAAPKTVKECQERSKTPESPFEQSQQVPQQEQSQQHHANMETQENKAEEVKEGEIERPAAEKEQISEQMSPVTADNSDSVGSREDNAVVIHSTAQEETTNSTPLAAIDDSESKEFMADTIMHLLSNLFHAKGSFTVNHK